ncbi:MAG: cytochrome c [Chitinophagales bacterium]
MRNKMFSIVALAAVVFMNSCGNGDKKNENESTDAAPQSMIQDTPKDDGQGIGKFKDVTLAALDTKVAADGKAIFESKCSACHKTTDQKVVGPGLKGVTTRRQPAWILNMMTNPIEMTQKDPTAKALLAEHLTQMTFQDVSDEQAKQILEYLRQNDADETTAEAKK